MSTTYEVTVSREDRWWMVRIPAISGLTQARRLAEAGQMAREFIALSLDVPVAEVDVNVTVVDVDGIDVSAAVDAIRAQRGKAAELERDASARAAALARELSGRRLTVRDIGTILGVSHQRAHQLLLTDLARYYRPE